jgi:excisionase family DNA binding protein
MMTGRATFPTVHTWYTPKELSQRIDGSYKTIWTWIRDGKLRSTRYGSRHRISEADWQECLDRFNGNEN